MRFTTHVRCKTCYGAMSLMGHERRIGRVRNISGLLPKADVRAGVLHFAFVPIAPDALHQKHRYSISRLASSNRLYDTSSPSAFAALRLITSSNLTGDCTGR